MKKVFLKQEEENDCGYAVSAIMINSLQRANISIDELKFKFPCDSEQLSLEEISNILNKYFIDIDVYEAQLKEIIFTYNRPMIMYMKNDASLYHFIICYEKKKDNYLISDPASNDLKWIPEKELEKNYAGFVAVGKKIEDYKVPRFKLSPLNKIFSSHFKWYLISVGLSFFLSIGLILSSNFTKIYFNNVTIGTKKFIQDIFIGFIILNVILILFEFATSAFERFVKRKIQLKAMMDFIVRFQNISADEFESIPLEKWMAKTNSISFYIDYKYLIFVTLPTKSLLFIFSVITLSRINLIFLFFTIFQNTLAAFISFYFTKFTKKISFNQQNINLKTMILLTDVFHGHESIKAKNLTNVFSERVKDNFETFDKSENKNDTKVAIMSKVYQIISQGVYFFITYWCVSLIQDGEIAIGDIMFYFTVNAYINEFASVLLRLIRDRSNYFLHTSELNYVYNELKFEEKKKINYKISEIYLDDVSKVRGGKNIFQPLKAKINSNTFIFGRSGIGKSTIFKIINGSYEKYSGGVFFNEHNIREFSSHEIANHIFYLGQYDYLFSDTVFENIKMFSKIDLAAFAKFGVFEILQRHNIPLDKKIKNNGSNLSKGQRQIINFLATLFIKRDIFIIDESLSNVDEETAELLLKLFFYVHHDAITIFCSHNQRYKSLFKQRIEVM
jgi:ABC-type bacteriocin/lantibiotic exporter with double-glycine peptidase domain